MKRLSLFLVLLFSISNLGFSEEKKSDWLSNKPGASENKLGARVESVENTVTGQRIKVSLPDNDKFMEEVIVIGKKPKSSGIDPILFKIQNVEVINNTESGRRGILFYLGERGDFVFRLNYQQADPLYMQRKSLDTK